MRAIIVFLTLSGLSVAGCITTPASETGYSKRARDLVPRACGKDALIEDGEDGDSRILVQGGRGGYWYTSIDQAGTTMDPVGTFKMGAPGHAGSRHGARIHGRTAGSGDSIYASMGFAVVDPKAPYDAGRYAGISFWAKGPAHIRFQIGDAYTSTEGGHCKDCFNHFGIELALKPDWQRYTIPFEWLSQRQGWGEPRPQIDKAGLFAMEWQLSTPGKDFDVWVDDVEFVCGTQGSAP
jgi:hypothetical protein